MTLRQDFEMPREHSAFSALERKIVFGTRNFVPFFTNPEPATRSTTNLVQRVESKPLLAEAVLCERTIPVVEGFYLVAGPIQRPSRLFSLWPEWKRIETGVKAYGEVRHEAETAPKHGWTACKLPLPRRWIGTRRGSKTQWYFCPVIRRERESSSLEVEGAASRR